MQSAWELHETGYERATKVRYEMWVLLIRKSGEIGAVPTQRDLFINLTRTERSPLRRNGEPFSWCENDGRR